MPAPAIAPPSGSGPTNRRSTASGRPPFFVPREVRMPDRARTRARPESTREIGREESPFAATGEVAPTATEPPSRAPAESAKPRWREESRRPMRRQAIARAFSEKEGGPNSEYRAD